MKPPGAVLVVVAGALIVSCSEKPVSDRETSPSPSQNREAASEAAKGEEDEGKPHEDKIAEDCVAFVRATKVVRSASGGSTDCPGCPPGGAEALAFRGMKMEAVSCTEDTCTVVVTIHAVFNPGSGEALAGGLTAWIPLEQRSAYLSGQTPSGEQVYRVKVTYKRRGEAWRAAEFDRAQ